MKKFLIASLFFIILAIVASVSAIVNQTIFSYYGIIEDDGSLTETQTTLNNFNAIGFICSNNDCSSIAGNLWNSSVINSGSNYHISLTYPTTLQQNGYGIFFYKEEYFPAEAKSTLSGNGQAPTATAFLTRKRNCRVPIERLYISHNGTNITVSVNLTAGVSSPVQSAGPLNYTPEQIAHLYAVDANVEFRFLGPEQQFFTRTINLPASEIREVSVSSVMAAGEYTIEVETNSNDVKCLNSLPVVARSNITLADNRTNAAIPIVRIRSPEPKTYSNRTILVDIDSRNATSVFYNWNGQNVNYSGPHYVTFSEGTNTMRAYAVNDVATAFDSVTFNVNTTINQTNETDINPPAPVSNLRIISRGTNYLLWGWTNPTDSDFNQAIIYLNGVNVANTSNGFYNATGLLPNSAHTITINTKDFNGNVNTFNVSNTAMTLPLEKTDGAPVKNSFRKKAAFPEIEEENETIVQIFMEDDEIIEIKAKEGERLGLLNLMLMLLGAGVIILIVLIIALSLK